MKFQILNEWFYKSLDDFKDVAEKVGLYNDKEAKVAFIRDMYELDDIEEILNKNKIEYTNLDDAIYDNYELFDKDSEEYNEWITDNSYELWSKISEDYTKKIKEIILALKMPGVKNYYDVNRNHKNTDIKFKLSSKYRNTDAEELLNKIESMLGIYTKITQIKILNVFNNQDFMKDGETSESIRAVRLIMPNCIYNGKNEDIIYR